MIHHAQDEGDALRARIAADAERNNRHRMSSIVPKLRSTQGSPSPKKVAHRQVSFIEPTIVGGTDEPSEEQAERLLAMQESVADSSVETNDLPSTTTDLDPNGDQEQLLFMARQRQQGRQANNQAKPVRQVQPARIAFETNATTNRVGWRQSASSLICHGCYAKGHVPPQCTHN